MDDKLMTRYDELVADLRRVIADAGGMLGESDENADEQTHTLRNNLTELAAQARRKLEVLERATRRRAGQATHLVDVGVREHPWESVGLAAGIGLIVGWLISRR